MKQPLLSICIPTYNRADVLFQTLSSITKSNLHGNDIEVVIADNHSSDNTEKVVKFFMDKYKYIKYYRNTKNIGGDRNFINVLSLGTGLFLKLHSDYSCFTSNGLNELYKIVNTNKLEKPLLFFANGRLKNISFCIYSSLNDFCFALEHGIAWIGSYGFWKDQFDSLEEKEAYIESHFMQIDWIFRLFVKHKECHVYNDLLTERKSFKSKQGGYHFLKVHLINFFVMFEPYIKNGSISKNTVVSIKRKVLPIMLYWIFILDIKKDPQYSYAIEDSFKILFMVYFKYPWFYLDTIKWLWAKASDYAKVHFCKTK